MDGVGIRQELCPLPHHVRAHRGHPKGLQRATDLRHHLDTLFGRTQTLVVDNTGVPSGVDSRSSYSSMSIMPSLRLALRTTLTISPVTSYCWPTRSGCWKVTLEPDI